MTDNPTPEIPLSRPVGVRPFRPTNLARLDLKRRGLGDSAPSLDPVLPVRDIDLRPAPAEPAPAPAPPVQTAPAPAEPAPAPAPAPPVQTAPPPPSPAPAPAPPDAEVERIRAEAARRQAEADELRQQLQQARLAQEMEDHGVRRKLEEAERLRKEYEALKAQKDLETAVLPEVEFSSVSREDAQKLVKAAAEFAERRVAARLEPEVEELKNYKSLQQEQWDRYAQASQKSHAEALADRMNREILEAVPDIAELMADPGFRSHVGRPTVPGSRTTMYQLATAELQQGNPAVVIGLAREYKERRPSLEDFAQVDSASGGRTAPRAAEEGPGDATRSELLNKARTGVITRDEYRKQVNRVREMEKAKTG